MPQDVNYGFYQDQTLKPYDPNDYLAAMQQGNPWFNPAYPTFDAVGGLSATMKSIKAMQLQSEMAAENKRRYDDEAKRRQTALDTNVARSNEGSLPGREAQGTKILGPGADPQDIARFVDPAYGSVPPTQQEQLEADFWATAKTFGFSPENPPDPATSEKIQKIIRKEGEYGSSWGTAQASMYRNNKVDEEFRVFKAAADRRLEEDPEYTTEMYMRDLTEYRAKKPGATAGAVTTASSKEDYRVTVGIRQKIGNSVRKMYENFKKEWYDTEGKAIPDEKMTSGGKMAGARYDQLVALYDRIDKWLKIPTAKGGEFTIPSEIRGALFELAKLNEDDIYNGSYTRWANEINTYLDTLLVEHAGKGATAVVK